MRVSRRALGSLYLACLMASCVGLSPAWSQDSPPRPNIVYILADDLGWADVGFHGEAGEVPERERIRTPRLDRLAASGARLEQFYVQSLCSPTRTALLTGKYPLRLGLHVGVVRPWAQYGLPLEERLLPQALRDAGYETAIVGKWHLGHFDPAYLPTRRGFVHQYGHYNGAIDYVTHERDGGLDWHRNDRALREEGYSTHLLAQEAVRRISQRDPTKPLFLYVPFNAVHAPHQVPDAYKVDYAHLPEPRRTYAGMVAALDEAVGRIVDQIESSGITDQTLIVFHSDNGGPNPGQVTHNGKLRAGKGTLYEGGVRVPAVAAWPRHIQPGTVVNQPLHVVDWYPTLLRLAGAKVESPESRDGRDAWATIASGQSSPHSEIVLNATPTAGAIRVGSWKLVVNGDREHREGREPGSNDADRAGSSAPREERIELFDLASDPFEQTNLADRHPEQLSELRKRYQVFVKQAIAPRATSKPPGFQSPAVWGER